MKALKHLIMATTALASGGIWTGVAFADDLPILAAPGPLSAWSVDHAMFDFGAQVFIDGPGKTASNSAAKFNQYGNQTNPVYLKAFNVDGTDGVTRAEILGKNIATDDQDLEVNIWQPGQNYLTFGWYQVPNFRSNTAETLYNGVGGNNLTIPSPVVQQIYNGLFNTTGVANVANGPGFNSTIPVQNLVSAKNGTPINAFVPNGCLLTAQGTVAGPFGVACKPGVTPVQTTINNNVNRIDLGIQHDRKEIDERWTPNENWDVKVQYSNDHRWGTQEQGFLFSAGTSTPVAQVPMPVNDTTQDASISAEYNGISPWGLKWNAMVKYDLSIFTDQFAAFTAENPFGGPNSPAGAGVASCPLTNATTKIPDCYGIGQESTLPSNGANAIMGQVGVDLPWFKSSRYMLTFNFNDMQQNQQFIPMTINAAGVTGLYPITAAGATAALLPMPRSSLNGNIDTLLVNNVLTSNITSDLKNKVQYRIFSDQNHTPQLTLRNFLVNDTALAPGAVGGTEYAPHGTLFSSYVKQNANDELTWRALSNLTLGGFAGWERFDYTQYPVNYTNEETGKLFANYSPTDWLTVRANEAYSVRRYGAYNWANFLGAPSYIAGNPTSGLAEAPALVDFNVSNRNRNVASLYVDLQTPIEGLTFTPTASMRWDDYPTDQALLNSLATNNSAQQGVKFDHNWTAGIEGNYTINSNIQLMAAYMHSNDMERLIATQSAASVYGSDMSDYVHTIMAGATWQLIPDKLVLKLTGTHEISRDTWVTGPVGNCLATIAATASAANCGVVSPGNPGYPPMTGLFDHIDAKLTYKIDESLMHQFGFNEGYFSVKFMYEQNSLKNWQTNDITPYMYSVLNSSTTSLKEMVLMGGDNPNYRAEAVLTSFVLKW